MTFEGSVRAGRRTIVGVAPTFVGALTDELGEPVVTDQAVSVAWEATDGETGGADFAVVGDDGTVTLTPSWIPPRPRVVIVDWASDDGLLQSRTVHEVVGGFVFGLNELRQFDPLLMRKDTATLAAVRLSIEQFLERECGRAFTPQFARRVLRTGCTDMFRLPLPDPQNVYKIFGVEVDGTFTLLDVPIGFDETGRVWSLDGTLFPERVVVDWDHGQLVCPPEVSDAAMMLARHRLAAASSQIPDRATSMVQAGTDVSFRLAVAGRPNQPTGIGDVDEVINFWRVKNEGVG